MEQTVSDTLMHMNAIGIVILAYENVSCRRHLKCKQIQLLYIRQHKNRIRFVALCKWPSNPKLAVSQLFAFRNSIERGEKKTRGIIFIGYSQAARRKIPTPSGNNSILALYCSYRPSKCISGCWQPSNYLLYKDLSTHFSSFFSIKLLYS